MGKLSQKGVIQVVVLLILLAGVVGGVYLVNRGEALKWFPKAFTGIRSLSAPISGPIVCAQVITPAKNPATNECKQFPSPCEVPTGWQKVAECISTASLPCTVCNADLNKDGVVNNSDIAKMTSCVNGKTKGLACSSMDFSGNGAVDQKDLQCLRSVYNQKCNKGLLRRN